MWESGKLLINQFVGFIMQISLSITRGTTMKLFVILLVLIEKSKKATRIANYMLVFGYFWGAVWIV